MKGLKLIACMFCLNSVAACATGTHHTIVVVDDDGKPVEGANVHAVYHGEPYDTRYTPRAITDANGTAKTSGPSTIGSLFIDADKTGYYDTDTVIGGGSKKKGKDISTTILLREKRNPIAMYARRFEKKRLVVPERDKKLGFDFFKGDWVLPGYSGINVDVFFKVTNQEDQIRFKKYGQSVEITFPNTGDGIQIANLNKAWHISDYTFHYNAPESGYQDSLVGFYTEANGKATEQYVKDDFYIRIRSKSDDLGNVVEAIYCKIREGILPAGYLDKTNAALGFTYYCNPTPNDTNVEFDPRKNLSTTLGKYNYVDEP